PRRRATTRPRGIASLVEADVVDGDVEVRVGARLELDADQLGEVEVELAAPARAREVRERNLIALPLRGEAHVRLIRVGAFSGAVVRIARATLFDRGLGEARDLDVDVHPALERLGVERDAGVRARVVGHAGREVDHAVDGL